jgi:ureidoacrylate peracid hydrolase
VCLTSTLTTPDAATGIEEEHLVPLGPDLTTAALIIVDMQNDFLHRDGAFGRLAREDVDAQIDLEFLASTIPHVRRLAEAFRHHGRPVVYVAHVLKPDYSDAAFPYWRFRRPSPSPSMGAGPCVEGTWGAQIVDELTPQAGEHLVIKKGFGGFANTPLETILRNAGVTTCVVAGVTTQTSPQHPLHRWGMRPTLSSRAHCGRYLSCSPHG